MNRGDRKPSGDWKEQREACHHELMPAMRTQAERLNRRIVDPNGLQATPNFEA
jgi:hypothetical protein